MKLRSNLWSGQSDNWVLNHQIFGPSRAFWFGFFCFFVPKTTDELLNSSVYVWWSYLIRWDLCDETFSQFSNTTLNIQFPVSADLAVWAKQKNLFGKDAKHDKQQQLF